VADVLNKALINDIEAHYSRPEQHHYPGNPILPDLSKYLESSGVDDPFTKIFITTDPPQGLPCVLLLFVLSQVCFFLHSFHIPEKLTLIVSLFQVSQLSYNKRLSTLVSVQKNAPLDGFYFL